MSHYKIPVKYIKKFEKERGLGDPQVNLGKQVRNLESSGTFQRLSQQLDCSTARGLAAHLVADHNKVSEANVWVSLSNR
jgi:hypothetical protein